MYGSRSSSPSASSTASTSGQSRAKLLPRAARENDFGHASAGGSTVAQLAAKIVERHRVAARKVGEAGFDGVERRWIGEELCGFFERLVLVDGDESSGRLAVASHEHVIAAVGDVAEQLAELRPELPTGTIFAMPTERTALRTPCWYRTTWPTPLRSDLCATVAPQSTPNSERSLPLVSGPEWPRVQGNRPTP